MEITPLKNNILLEVVKEEKNSVIILDDKYDDEVTLVGKIIKVSKSIVDLKEGDLVLFKKHLLDEVFLKEGSNKKVLLLGDVEAVTAKVKK